MKLEKWQKVLLFLLINWTAWSLYVDALYDPMPDTFYILGGSFFMGFIIFMWYDLDKKSKKLIK